MTRGQLSVSCPSTSTNQPQSGPTRPSVSLLCLLGSYLAVLNGLAVARAHLGSLDTVTRTVRPGVSVATAGDVRDQPNIADGASELLQDVFGKDKSPRRLVSGGASLPLDASVELETIFEVAR